MPGSPGLPTVTGGPAGIPVPPSPGAVRGKKDNTKMMMIAGGVVVLAIGGSLTAYFVTRPAAKTPAAHEKPHTKK